ncbi:MAG: GIY-YIG nuclease family protein [Vagococcus sp.]
MSFLKKIKELSQLRKTIEHEKLQYRKKKHRQQSQLKKINNKIKKDKNYLDSLAQQLSNKEETIQAMRQDVQLENEQIRLDIISKATLRADTLISQTESEISQKKETAQLKATQITDDANLELASLLDAITTSEKKIEELSSEQQKLTKEVTRYQNQARKFKAEITGLKNYEKTFLNSTNYSIQEQIQEAGSFLKKDGLLDSLVQLPLHSDQSKELKKLATQTRKEIDASLERYRERYQTKSNQAIYNLMIIGLQAEIQLLLYQLNYQKLEETKLKLHEIIQKFQFIVADGNQSILPTVTRFISEIEPLYLELIQIEYRYYLKRQQEKEEQQAIREQMKQEKEEKKALEIERRKLDLEESKYQTEMNRNKELLAQETDNTKILQLQSRLNELQLQLNNVETKKEEVTNLTLGKAGYVYVISNLGSFGENIFKIGMTRRLEPQQRVDELGSASVPFRFDVHAMIFSHDAVQLENTLHKKLSTYRVNKVNFRKEFFRYDVLSLEKLVEETDPTAEFTRTMLAEEYLQTLAIEKVN